MKSTSSLVLFLILTACAGQPSFAEPVMKTTLEEAIKSAPLILLAESGKQEFDDLQEGETVKLDTMQLECRKQHFKVLKVYRNSTPVKVSANSDLQIHAKSNSCIVFDVSVKRQGNDLVVSYLGNTNNQPFTISTKQKSQKDFLFLSNSGNSPTQLEHYGWFVSPKPYTAELETQLQSLPPLSKKTIQLNSDCK